MVSSLDNWDGSLSKTVKQQSARVTDLLDNSAGASTTTIQNERIKPPTIGIRHGWQDRVTTLDVNYTNDASNLNRPLPRGGLVPRPPASSTLSVVASQSGTTNSPAWKTPYFTPVVSSPLQDRLPQVIPTPIVLTLPNPVTPRGRSIPSMHLDTLETISTYTADGDGEYEEDEEETKDITVVHDILAPYTASTSLQQNLSQSSTPSQDSPLFTPLLKEEDTRSIGHLFTPSLLPQPSQAEPTIHVHHQPRPRRLIMSHIEVPPLKRPWSDYRSFPRTHSIIVNKRRISGPPSTLQKALQASIQHNADVGVPSWDSSEKKKWKKRNREENAVAGPSSFRPIGAAFSFGIDKPAGIKKKLKRPFVAKDDEVWGAPPRSKKRPRSISDPVVVDLTMTDDDQPSLSHLPSSINLTTQNPGPKVNPAPEPNLKSISAPLPRRRPAKKSKFVHAVYNSEADIVTLCLEDIRPVPTEILTRNTRFLRVSLGNDVNAEDSKVSALGPEGIKSTDINRTRQNGSRPCLLSTAANSSQTMDDQEEISAGGIIWELSEEEVEREVVEILSESDADLKEDVPQKYVDLPPLSTSQVHPNAGLKVHHQKKPREPQQKPKRRRQSRVDDADKSPSTFDAPLGKIVVSSLPPPRTIPSNTKAIHATQYLKKARKSKQPGKRKQTSDNGITHKQTITHSLLTPKVKVSSQHPKKRQVELLHPLSDNASPVRRPHSARSSPNGQTLSSGSDYPNNPVPSAKALGKRRAISPTSISATTTPQRHLHFPVPSYSASPIQLLSHRSSASTPTHYPYLVQNSDFNGFLTYPTAISPAAQSSSAQVNGADPINTSSFSSSYDALDTLASLYDPASLSQTQSKIHIGSDIDTSRHTSTHSHSLVYNNAEPQPGPGSRGESFFSSANSLYDDVGLPGDQYDNEPQQHYDTTIDNPWSSSIMTTNRSEDQYLYQTIDPTLLGGGEFLGEAELEPEIDMVGIESDTAEMEPEFETGFEDHVQQEDDSSQLESGSVLSKESSPLSSSSQMKKTYPSVQSIAPPYNHALDDDKQQQYTRKLPPRIRTKRIMPDMISHDEIDLLSSRKRRAPSSPASSAAPDADKSDSDSETDYESDDREPTIRKPTIRKPIMAFKSQVSTKQPHARLISPIEQKAIIPRVDQKQDWPMDDVESACHQCRRKTLYAKMSCSSCKKKYCVRCYAFRYPESEFDASSKDYSCPACEGFCNCTVCSRGRGELYVGVRTCDVAPNSPVLPSRRRRNPNAKRVKLSRETNLASLAPAIRTTTIPKGVTEAWGSLYSVTGEKIGACFFDPSVKKNKSVVFAPATTPVMTTITEVAQQVATAAAPRDQPKIQVKKMKRRIFVGMVQSRWGYTKPKIKLLKAEPYAKRSYSSMPRYYVGKKKYLFYPIEAGESSLTAEEVEVLEEPNESEVEGKSFSFDSLGDGDIARAILLGLSACGVAAVEVPSPAI